MKLLEEVGGARVGFKNASWPFARLTMSKKELRLTVKLIGRYHFSPHDIEQVEVVNFLPLVGKGIRLRHSVEDYPAKLIFWTLSDPRVIADKIQKAGFGMTSTSTNPE